MPVAAINDLTDQPFVRIPEQETYREQPITVLLRGTDGQIAIDGVAVGAEIILNR